MSRVKDKPNPPNAGRHWGAKIAERRVKMGMTQGRFAELIGINVRTVQAWESGRRTSMYTDMVENAISRLESETPPVEPDEDDGVQSTQDSGGVPSTRDPADRRKRLRHPVAAT